MDSWKAFQLANMIQLGGNLLRAFWKLFYLWFCVSSDK